MSLDNDFLNLKWNKVWLILNLPPAELLRVTIQERGEDKYNTVNINVPEIKIEDIEDNLDDHQEEWEMEDCEELEYEFYETEVSKLWFGEINQSFILISFLFYLGIYNVEPIDIRTKKVVLVYRIDS